MTGTAFATAALWSYGLAAVGYLAFALRVALGLRRSPRSAWLLAAVLVTALWAGVTMTVALAPTPATFVAADAFGALRYACWFGFLASVLAGGAEGRAEAGAQSARPRVPRWSVVLAAVALVASVAIPLGDPFASPIVPEARKIGFGLKLGLAVAGLILVEQLVRRTLPHARWSIKPLAVGLGGLFAFDLFQSADAMLYGRLDPDIWVARGVANLLVIPFVAISAARNPAWKVEMHMSRGVVFHSTALLLSGVFLIAVAAAGYIIRFLGGDWGRALQIELVFAAVLFAVLVATSGRFRSRLSVFVSKHFFSYRFDYRAEWLRFTRTLAAESSLAGVEANCIKAIADLVESPAGALWLEQEDGAFVAASRWNMAAVEGALPADAPLARFLERTGWVIDVGEFRADAARYPDLELPGWLDAVSSAWLVVPLISGTELVGFVVLATPRAKIELDWEVRDLLKTASRQAASYLGQIRATEALLEARKFDAFNRMSAFVVHDLKNLVAQLSLMLRNSERHRGNPEFQRDMLATVEHVVARMNQLMLQLRMGTTPVEKARPVELEALVRRVCAAKAATGARIDVEAAAGIYAVGHEERLEHVVGHLVQNALDATAKGGRVAVHLSREGAVARLEVADTGPGMTPEFVRDRLFKPFATTKASGMGIGVYESSQYLAAMGGRIDVDSAPGAGTRMRVFLPAADAAAARAGTLEDAA